MTAFTTIPKSELDQLKTTYERRMKSRWVGDKGFVKTCLLPWRHGDGQKAVLLSFYAAPETAIVILVDSGLPLELPEDERFQPHGRRVAFRDLLDTIYDVCEDTWTDPPTGKDSLKQLKEKWRIEYDEDEEISLWSLVLNDGGTWGTF